MYAIGAMPQPHGWREYPSSATAPLAYVISGVLAAIGGILRQPSGRGDIGAGNAYLLQAVSAALIGFAVLGANRPNALGTPSARCSSACSSMASRCSTCRTTPRTSSRGSLLVLTLVLTVHLQRTSATNRIMIRSRLVRGEL